VISLNCIFASDLHGKIKHYENLFKIVSKEKPEAVFLGGDLLPIITSKGLETNDFIEDEIFSQIKKIKNEINESIKFFIILGNDDPRIFEKKFLNANKKNLTDYVHNKTVGVGDFFVSGYSFVPPTPFRLKDWEKYDVSRYVDVGAISPEEGIRTIKIHNDRIRYSTIAEDLEKLSKRAPIEKTIFLFHSPPYNSYLDRAELNGKKVDNAPVDVHVGSIAIQRFIEKKQPFLTLHGHIHESARLTGHWKQKFGRTYSFSAAHDGPELAVVRFNTDNLENATRELI